MFIDVDYPDLIAKKVSIVKNDKDLCKIIGDIEACEGVIALKSSSYIALSCDLRDLDLFESLLNECLGDLEKIVLLFTAEVSLTYMVRESADSLIAWASRFPNSRFCLLEQILPAGQHHPFAKTMLRHFNNLNTPLNSITKYPLLKDQISRFKNAGWRHVQGVDLYDLWKYNITEQQKHFVQTVEDFDEWEEFILFCQHYFVLFASSEELVKGPFKGEQNQPCEESLACSSDTINITTLRIKELERKFASSCSINGSSIINGGLTTSRLDSSLFLTGDISLPFYMTKSSPPSRMCHSMTELPNGDILLVGGRQSPRKVLKDCWILSNGLWTQVQDLQEPRFRHQCFCTEDGTVILHGGSWDNSPWLKWTRNEGWKTLNTPGISSIGATIAWNKNQGLLFGGMNSNYGIENSIFLVEYSNGEVILREISLPAHQGVFQRFGAKAVYLDDCRIVIAGGVSEQILDQTNSIAILNMDTLSVSSITPCHNSVYSELLCPLPGFNLDLIDNKIILHGGGAVCFSFGSYWNKTLILSEDPSLELKLLVKHPEPQIQSHALCVTDHEQNESIPRKSIERIRIDTEKEFRDIVDKRQPVLIEAVDLGACSERWNDLSYVEQKVGSERKIVAHYSASRDLSFHTKNFEYKTMKFGDFIRELAWDDNPGNSHITDHPSLYLRALSSSNPKNEPTNFWNDFPGLGEDFKLPSYMKHVMNSHFSSPLRISSPGTSMWLHYDVVANVLCQIVGTKKVRLFNPKYVSKLGFTAGSSTSTLERVLEMPLDELPAPAIDILMTPGDVLFIPAMWLHCTAPTTLSISLNVFWRDLEPQYYAGKDVYGNRDLAAYEQGRQSVRRIIDGFNGVPRDIRGFYLQRLRDELDEYV